MNTSPSKRKFWRVETRNEDGSTTCPKCGERNQHITGQNCGHVAKITAKGVVFYYWAFKPVNP